MRSPVVAEVKANHTLELFYSGKIKNIVLTLTHAAFISESTSISDAGPLSTWSQMNTKINSGPPDQHVSQLSSP